MSAARILVVEDNPSDIFLLKRVLNPYLDEIELEIAADGELAIEVVERLRDHDGEPAPCVILLDLHLPKYEGLEVLHFIRREPKLTHVHVVVTTSVASPRQEKELLSLGAQFRPKPSSMAQYAELAEDLIAICKGLPSREG